MNKNNKEEIIEIAMKASEEVLQLCEETFSDETIVDDKLRISKRKELEKGRPKVYKAILDLPEHTPAVVRDQFYLEKRKNWDTNQYVDHTGVLWEIRAESDPAGLIVVSRNAVKSAAGGLISARDFVDAASCRRLEDGSILQGGCSIDFEECPPEKQFVRGNLYPSGFIAKPAGNGTSLIYVVQSDIKGWIPKSVVESAMVSALKDINLAFREHMKSIPSS